MIIKVPVLKAWNAQTYKSCFIIACKVLNHTKHRSHALDRCADTWKNALGRFPSALKLDTAYNLCASRNMQTSYVLSTLHTWVLYGGNILGKKRIQFRANPSRHRNATWTKLLAPSCPTSQRALFCLGRMTPRDSPTLFPQPLLWMAWNIVATSATNPRRRTEATAWPPPGWPVAPTKYKESLLTPHFPPVVGSNLLAIPVN